MSEPAEIITIHGAPAPDGYELTFEPDPAVIEALEDMLERACQGLLVGFVAAECSHEPNGKPQAAWRHHGHVTEYRVLGALQVGVHRLAALIDESNT